MIEIKIIVNGQGNLGVLETNEDITKFLSENNFQIQEINNKNTFYYFFKGKETEYFYFFRKHFKVLEYVHSEFLFRNKVIFINKLKR